MSNNHQVKLRLGEKSQNSYKINTNVSISSELNIQDIFNERKICQHYTKLREDQHKKLGEYNLSQQLKKKLFGFSQGYYFSNSVDPYKMVIENHPIKGRIIMREKKYNEYCKEKLKERQIRKERQGSLSDEIKESHVSIGQLQQISGQIKLPFDIHDKFSDKMIKSNISSKFNNISDSYKHIKLQNQ